jgi:AraC-like DNA-binding protein/mannose-6-phosphate isomerase-like protein (cupin superfamily)
MATTEEMLHERVAQAQHRLLIVYFGTESIEWHTSSHSHASAQLMALTKGSASIRTDSGAWVLPPERCVFIPSNTVHSLDTVGDVRGFVAYLPAELERMLPRCVFTFQASGLLIEVAELTPMPERSDYEAHLSPVLVDEIRRSFALPLRMQMPLEPRLRSMASEILHSPNDAKSLAELSTRTGMSERTLLRRFREETGMTVGQWVQHARVQLAAEQLTDGASVKQAAASAGYDSVSSFIKSFTRIMGVTPGEHKKLHSEAERRALSS